MSQRLGLLGRELEALADRLGGAEIEDEGEDLHLGAAERAQERIDLVDAADELRPGQPCASGELVVILARRRGGGVSLPLGLKDGSRILKDVDKAVMGTSGILILSRVRRWYRFPVESVAPPSPQDPPLGRLPAYERSGSAG